MRTPVPEYLRDLLHEMTPADGGTVADYIPELAKADPETFAIALTTVDGRTYSAGADDTLFTIQSISKPFAYAAALEDRGFDAVHAKVGMEPSGEAFNELSLERESNRPKNPMINAGALAVHSMLGKPGATRRERVARLHGFFEELLGHPVSVDFDAYTSEVETADRNLALAHMLRSYGIIEDTAHEIIDGYTAQCATLVTARDLSIMGSAFANGGVNPVTGKRVVSRAVARQTLSSMASAGMYNGAGAWFAEIGIPAKSGVSGGLLGVLPGQVSVCVFSPRLDKNGNSVRGVNVFRRLSRDIGFHLMESDAYGSPALRSLRVREGKLVVRLQGAVQFTGAEAILHELEKESSGLPEVVFDVARVSRFNEIGRRMILEAMHRMDLDGRVVHLYDPDGVLPDPDLGDGRYPVLDDEETQDWIPEDHGIPSVG